MKVKILIGKNFVEVKISIKWGVITCFKLTLPWLLRIKNELSSKEIVDGNWPQGDNGESSIQIIDC